MKQSKPVTCMVYNSYMSWACDVALEVRIPCATLWVHSAAVFSTFYHYYHKTVSFPTETQPEINVVLPCLPVLTHDEIPSFLHPNDKHRNLFLTALMAQFEKLSNNNTFCVLIDTFEELESEIIKEISKLSSSFGVKSVGPLFKHFEDTSIRGDMIKAEYDCLNFLDSKPLMSVIYISFGSVLHLNQEQVKELTQALLNTINNSTGFSFLWVMKPFNLQILPDGFSEKMGERGKIVKWCPQESVLSHSSIGCFLTQCGWNSSMEALGSGVPVLGFPRWSDQVSNAKFLVDVFKVGRRLCRGVTKEERVIKSDEIEKGFGDVLVGEMAEELRRNALRWKIAAEEAVVDGGSSHRNILDFVEEILELVPHC